MSLIDGSRAEVVNQESTQPTPHENHFVDVLRGYHPEISRTSSTGISRERQDLEVHLILRDLFTPMCVELANNIKSRDQAEFGAIEKGFSKKPYKQNYPHDFEALRLAGLEAQYAFQSVDILRERKVALEQNIETDFSISSEYDELQRYIDDVLPNMGNPERRTFSPSTVEEARDLASLYSVIEINTNPKKAYHPGDIASGKFDSFLWVPTETETGKRTSVTREIVVPVGQYGEAFADRLIATTKVMLKIAEETAIGNSESIASKHQDLLQRATARGRDARDTSEFVLELFEYNGPAINSDNLEQVYIGALPLGDGELGDIEIEYGGSDIEEMNKASEQRVKQAPLIALQEGIMSLTNTLSLILAEKIPGYDDPSRALQAVVQQNLPNYLASISPMGLVGPMVFRGDFIEGFTQTGQTGMAEFEQSKAQELMRQRREKREEARERTSINRPNIVITGLGCPVARRDDESELSGIEDLSQAFLYIYNSL